MTVGSGRRHGMKPDGSDPMELRLYDATHHDTYWENPGPGDVAELIAWYVTLPGCSSGGSLHIAVEDHNLDDSHLQWCAGYAFGVGDTCGDELAGLLERMDVWNRVEAVRLADELRSAYVAGMAAGPLTIIDDPPRAPRIPGGPTRFPE